MGTIMGTPFFIAPSDVFARLGRADAPVVFDVRRPEIVAASDTMMPIARFRAPSEAVAEGRAEQSGRAVLVACAHGHNRSQQVVARLRSVGIDASAIAGGYDGWQAAGLPLVKRTARGVSLGAAPTVWVTRRRPKIDRVACPWLIHRFLDAQAAFLFVEPDQVLAVAEEVGGVAYDLPGAAFEHDGELCTFDTLLAAFALDADPLLRDLASIVRGADTARLDLAPQCAGLLAVALGLSAQHGDDDHAVLRHGFPVYDALYAWLRHAREERHNWPRAAMAAPSV
ncbi:MAG TPA: chromate resistance protein ChrB domain-containing protein [Beijerinckiaceae bacterium]|nr:chromate resistance protein ChrB domain-containing protein [Beijerinckiaceae bacterium]